MQPIIIMLMAFVMFLQVSLSRSALESSLLSSHRAWQESTLEQASEAIERYYLYTGQWPIYEDGPAIINQLVPHRNEDLLPDNALLGGLSRGGYAPAINGEGAYVWLNDVNQEPVDVQQTLVGCDAGADGWDSGGGPVELCLDDVNRLAKLRTNELRAIYLTTIKNSIHRTLQKFFGIYQMGDQIPEMGYPPHVSVASLVGYADTPENCSGQFSYMGVSLQCTDLFTPIDASTIYLKSHHGGGGDDPYLILYTDSTAAKFTY